MSPEDDFSPSDSENDYTENEKLLLDNVRNKKRQYSDDENEVYGVGSELSDTDDDDGSNLAVSDVEGQDIEDDLPNIRAWGKDKKQFYRTDYVDADYGGFQEKDARLAELEEEEARNLQKQLAQQLDDDDFSLDLFAKKTEEDQKYDEEIIKTDLSKLSKRQKLQILQKESPEFFSLIEDFQGKMLIARDYLHPVLQKYKRGQIPSCEAIDFIQTQYELILNYCNNIYMYLLLKSTKTNVQNHPVIKRLFQYRQLLLQLEPVFNEIIKPQVELLTREDELEDGIIEHKKKTLKLLSSLKRKVDESKEKKKQVIFVEPPSKKVKVDENSSSKKNADLENQNTSDSSDDDPQVDDKPEEEEGDNESSKRAITYKMAKNKGLTPHRKKEQRNPRVKHKLKYRKAVIRRKGAVREPRKELQRYSGEISGIKASVSRSVKIKT